MVQVPASAEVMAQDAYRAIFENSLDGVMFTIPDGRILAANPAACQLLGRSEEEICALGRQGLTDPTDPRWVTSLAERARTGRTRTQGRMIRGDGTTFEADFSSAIFSTPDGERRACLIFRDLSDRLLLTRELTLAEERDRIAHNLHATVMRRISAASMQAHGLASLVTEPAGRAHFESLIEELDQTLVEVRDAIFRLGSESERRYQALVESMPVAVAVYRGQDTRFVYANQGAIEVYGARDLDDMLSRHAVDVIPKDLLAGWEQRVQRVLDGAVIRHGQFRLLRFDGREISVEANAVKITFDGEPCVQLELHQVGNLTEPGFRAAEVGRDAVPPAAAPSDAA